MTAAIRATDRDDPERYREAVALAEQALARAVTLWDRSPQPRDVDLPRSWSALAGRFVVRRRLRASRPTAHRGK